MKQSCIRTILSNLVTSQSDSFSKQHYGNDKKISFSQSSVWTDPPLYYEWEVARKSDKLWNSGIKYTKVKTDQWVSVFDIRIHV